MEQVEQEIDSLSSLEERVVQAIQLVTRLRQEKDALSLEIQELTSEKEAALKKLSASEAKSAEIAAEVEALRSERKQVRNRIEKLLGQIDQLSGA